MDVLQYNRSGDPGLANERPRPLAYVPSEQLQADRLIFTVFNACSSPTPARDAACTMSLLYWLRRLYSLDTLDTRFTVPANTPLKAAADTRSSPSASADPSAKDARSSEIANGASPSRWKTPEYFVYYLVFVTLVPLMFKTVIGVSQGWYLLKLRYSSMADITDNSQRVTLLIPPTRIYCLLGGFPAAKL